jgi:hypothetical protein
MSYRRRSETSRTAWFAISWFDLCVQGLVSIYTASLSGRLSRNVLDAKLDTLEPLRQRLDKLGLDRPHSRGRHYEERVPGAPRWEASVLSCRDCSEPDQNSQ